MTTTAPDDLALTRGHYAALRAHLQGLPAATISGLYLGHGANGGDPVDVRRVVRELWEVRDALIQRAHQHGQPELALALQRAVRGSNAGIEHGRGAAGTLERSRARLRSSRGGAAARAARHSGDGERACQDRSRPERLQRERAAPPDRAHVGAVRAASEGRRAAGFAPLACARTRCATHLRRAQHRSRNSRSRHAADPGTCVPVNHDHLGKLYRGKIIPACASSLLDDGAVSSFSGISARLT